MFNNVSNRSLNQDQRVIAFLQRAETPSGRKAAVGDPDKVPANLRPAVANSHAALERLPAMIVAVIGDKTRESAALKHDAVRTVGNQTIATLQRTQTALREGVKDALARSNAAIDGAFTPNPLRAGIESEIRGHIRTLAAKPEGIAEIRKLVASDPEAAGVFSFSPPYLLGVAPEVKKSIHGDILKQHVPEAFEFAQQAVDLSALAERYTETIAHVGHTWFDGIADGARTRVDVDA